MSEHLTSKQHAQLATELAALEGPKRAEIVEAIKVARSWGDLSENFEYHAAKNEQGLLERQIRVLRSRLDNSVIVDSAGADVVSIGSHVTFQDETGERQEVEISVLGGAGTVSPSAPLGKVLLGRRAGEAVDVKAPSGTWTATIVTIRTP